MNEIISLFIDDEMNLEDKIGFIERLRNHSSFADETLDLLRLEKLVRSDVVTAVPLIQPVRPNIMRRFAKAFMQPIGWVSTGFAAALVALVIIAVTYPGPAPIPKNRFVIYMPDVKQVEIAGSFTNWRRIPMQRAGDSGYWELTLSLSQGEHYFSYIVEGRQQIADPTIRTRVPDDYGGFNSILFVEDRA
jgi:hypothetical protein